MFPSEQRNKYIIYIGILIVLNIALSNMIEPGEAQRFDGSEVSIREARSSAIRHFTIGTVIFGALLGLVVALLPYRGLKYGKKYVRAFLLSMLGLELLWLLVALGGWMIRSAT